MSRFNALMCVGWAVLGVLALTDGRPWLGAGLLTLAALHLASAVSPKARGVLHGPVFARRQ